MKRNLEENIILGILEIESGRHGQLVENPNLETTDTDGGYTNNPADRGGPTNWGCTERMLKKLGIKTPIKKLTVGEAYIVFRNEYYTKCGADRLLSTHPHLANAMSNFSIHAGVYTAVSLLQGLLNNNNHMGDLYPDITVDGLFGMRTLKAFNELMSLRKEDGYEVIMTDYFIGIGARYQSIVRNDETQEEFSYGWSRRVRDMIRDFYEDTL